MTPDNAPMHKPVMELFVAIVQWAGRCGAINIGAMDGPWKGETDEWLVEINGHADEIDGIPPYSVQLKHKVYLQLGIIDPGGGVIVGANEDEMIEHFKTATPGKMT